MRVDKIQTFYQERTFKAGKVRVFSDFDRTFLPSSHKNFVKNNDTRFVKTIRENFKSFKDFLNNTKESLNFTITTGRTFGEFLTMAEVARERKFGMPLPDTLIIKNGSDEHIKTGSDEDFYNGGEFPFKYEVTNKEKEAKIKELSGWDGAKVKKIIYDALKLYNFRIVEADSEHGADDYGSRSMFSQGKIPYEVGKVFYGTDKADWSVGIRKDGFLKSFLTFPPDMHTVEERKIAFSNIKEKIKNNFDKEGFKTQIFDKDLLHERPCIIYTPGIPEEIEGGLTKLYDTLEAFQKARSNNDLVIVAGDSSNDFEMLNPGFYLKQYLTDEIYNKYGKENLLKALKTPKSLIDILNKDKELAEAFIKMPFRGVIVRQNGGENKLDQLEPFASGKYQKIIVVDEGELQSGIKQSIKAYTEQNPKYKENLGEDLKEIIKEEPEKETTQIADVKTHKEKDNVNKNNEQNKDNNNTPNDEENNGGNNDNSGSKIWKYALGIIGALGLGGGIYAWNKNKKDNLKKQV